MCGSIPCLGRFLREESGNSLQYSCLENPTDRGTWWATVRGLQRVGHDWVWHIFVQELLTKASHLGQAQWYLLAWIVSQQEVPIKNSVLLPKTNLENLGGPKGGGRRWCVLPTVQRSSHWNPSCLRGTGHQEGLWVRWNLGQARWLARDNLETNPVAIKPETVSYVAEQFSWVSLPCCSPPGCSFPKFLLFVSMCLLGQFVSKCWTRAPLLGPGKGLPSYNIYTYPYLL